jgi:Tfp pilus assembly protein FimV
VAKTMARSPLNPSASLLTPPKVGNSASAQRSTIRRTPAAGAQARSAPVTNASGTVSAAALAAQMTGTSAPVQRSQAPVTAPAPAAAAPAAPSPAAPSPVAPAPAASASHLFDSPAADEWFKDQLRNNFSHIMNMIEDRMIEELERRGGRIWGGL